MNPGDFWYIRLREHGDRGEQKRPAGSWGGYDQDFESADTVHTYEETQELDHSRFGIVGHQECHRNRRLIVIDADCYKADDFDPDKFRWPEGHTSVIKSIAPERDIPGFHFYVLFDSDEEIYPEFDWIDIQCDGNSHVVSPWHCEGYELVWNTELKTFRTVDKLNKAFEYDDEPIVREQARSTHSGEYQIPDETPDELPDCIGKLAAIRGDKGTRETYTGSNGPFSVDTHLGQLLVANGYDMEEAISVFAEHPPPDGYDEETTQEHLKRLYRKHQNGELQPPVGALEPEIDPAECDCSAHDFDDRVTFLPGPDTGWNWEERREFQAQDAHERVEQVVNKALTQQTRVIIEAVPGMGKSRSAVKASAQTGESVAILVKRGHEEMYEQYEEWCERSDLSSYRLPVFGEDCETARGDYGEEPKKRVWAAYDRGATPREIHVNMDTPCTHGDQTCTYQQRWSSDEIGTSDVLIGHYTHTHVGKVRQGRTLVFDEFSESAFEREFDAAEVNQTISTYLKKSDEWWPFETAEEVREASDDFDIPTHIIDKEHSGVDVSKSTEQAFTDGGHVEAPYALLTLLWGKSRDDDLQTFDIDGRRCVLDRKDGSLAMLTPPDLWGSNGVVVLDGTPEPDMWELILDTSLDHEVVLEDHREEFIEEARQMTIVQTSPHVNTVGVGGENVTPERTEELLELVEDQCDEEIGIVTHPTAKAELSSREAFRDRTVKYFGNLQGSNELKHTHVGVVTHSSHYGDDFARRWCAYAGKPMEREGSGLELSYGEFGDRVLRFMRESQVLQGVLRFGRDESPTWVYVDTATLPDWVPVTKIGDFRAQDGRHQVQKAIRHLDEPFTVRQVTEQVKIKRRQVDNILEELETEGLIQEQEGPGAKRWVVTAEVTEVSLR